MNIKRLIIALARKMSFLRKSRSISKYATSEIFAHAIRILVYHVSIEGYRLTSQMKNEIIEEIELIVEPLDKYHLAPLWHKAQKSANVIDVIEDYERRCFAVVNKLKEDPKTSKKLRNYLSNLSFLREDFLRHLIIRSNHAEYDNFASELTVIYWFIFGWNDEIDAYDHFLRITVEACCLSLEYPSIGPQDLFVFLLKSFTRFSRLFALFKSMNSPNEVYESLIKNMNSLKVSIKCSPYASLFDAFLERLNNVLQHNSLDVLQDVLDMLDQFVHQCLEFDRASAEEVSSFRHTSKVSDFFVTYEVISACMKVPTSEAYECIRRMNELFASS